MKTSSIWTADRVAEIANEYNVSKFFVLTHNGADALGFETDDGMFAVAPGSKLGELTDVVSKLSVRYRESLSRLNLINDDMTLKTDERFCNASDAAGFAAGCLCDERGWKPYESMIR